MSNLKLHEDLSEAVDDTIRQYLGSSTTERQIMSNQVLIMRILKELLPDKWNRTTGSM